MKRRTEEEIQHQIEGLENMKKIVPERSFFGDENWKKIDAQIAVLKGNAVPNDYYRNEHDEDYNEGDNDIWSDAELAEQWLNGEEDNDLFEE
jgi:hypothetical protein